MTHRTRRLERQAEVHMIAGLLLEGLDALPADRDFMAAEGASDWNG